MLMCLFSPAVPGGWPITVVPLKQRAGQPARARRQRAASRPSRRPAPTEGRTCENPWVRLCWTTVSRTHWQPSPGQQYSTVLPSEAGFVATSAGFGSRKPAGATTRGGAAGGGGGTTGGRQWRGAGRRRRGRRGGGSSNGGASRRPAQRRGPAALYSATLSRQ